MIEAQSDDSNAAKFCTRFLSGDARAGWMIHADSSLHYFGRLFIPVACRDVILREFHCSPLAVHPGGMKMYHDLRRRFWWPGMKKDVALFVSRCLTCQQVKAEHQRPAGLNSFLVLVFVRFLRIRVDLYPILQVCFIHCLSQSGSGSMLRWISLQVFLGRLVDRMLFGLLLIV